MRNYDYFIENDLPIKQYYDQFQTSRSLQVGKTYYQHAGTFWKHYKILFVGHGVALAEEISNGNNNYCIGGKVIFCAEGNKAGWVYGDNRSVYRLIKEI